MTFKFPNKNDNRRHISRWLAEPRASLAVLIWGHKLTRPMGIAFLTIILILIYLGIDFYKLEALLKHRGETGAHEDILQLIPMGWIFVVNIFVR